jgi:hypothetical protein
MNGATTVRISRKQLEAMLAELAELQQRPAATYTRYEDGRYHANKGALHLDLATVYGGWDAVVITNAGGGEASICGNGPFGSRLSRREMYYFLLGALWSARYAQGDRRGWELTGPEPE